MISFRAGPVLAVAIVVFTIWRVVTWRRRGGDAVRELAVVSLFGWSLVIVYFTFFPLVIIFYDWHSRVSLVPFASILQLLRETTPALAFRNIVGNLLLFLPLGVLLPVLFSRLRSGRALLWRVATLSAIIELVQLSTRARAIDVDDVLLNTAGAMVGGLVFLVLAAALRRVPVGERLLERAGRRTDDHEPLTTGIVPVLATALLTVPVMVWMLIGQTVGDGPDGIEAITLDGWPDGSIVARADVAEHTLLVATGGPRGDDLLRLHGFERVLPGRYTPQVRGEDTAPNAGSRYQMGFTAYNPSQGELPVIYLWGVNREGATTVEVRGNGLDTTMALPADPYFALGFQFAPDELALMLEEFEISFFDADGADVSGQIPRTDG